MVPTVNAWTKYVDILKGFGEMGEILAAQAVGGGWSWPKRTETARGLFDACVAEGRDKHAVTMLELLERAYTHDREVDDLTEIHRQFRRMLEATYWALPDRTTSPGGGARVTLAATKRWIVEKLIVEWVAAPTAESINAFRRLIAMGWPLQERQQPRIGEHEVEIRARGRAVFEEERKSICEIVRNHMESFGSYEDRQLSPDALFGPWLAQSWVPDDLRNIMIVARTKRGGTVLVERDLRNGAILDGIPESGLDLVRATAERMREAAKAVQRVMYEALGTIEGHRHSSYARTHLLEDGDRWRFVSENAILLKVGPLGKAEDLLVAMVEAISRVRADSILKTFNLQLEVAGHMECGKIPLPLTKSWLRER